MKPLISHSTGIAIVSLVILAMSTSFISCTKKSEKCSSISDAVVDSANGPSTGTVNTDYVFHVYFGIGNGCGSFTGFDESRTGNIITVQAKLKFEGCVCTEIYQFADQQYIFKAATAGNYVIQFIKGEMNSVVQKSITIN